MKSIILWSVILSIILAVQLILINKTMNITLGYLSIIMFVAINLPLAIYATKAGARSLIKEESNGTIEYIYAQPISRLSIVFTKMATAVLSYAIILIIVGFVCLLTYLLVITPFLSFGELFDEIGNLFMCTFVIGLVFMTIGFMISAIKSKNKHTSGTSLLIVFGTYIAGFISILPNIQYLGRNFPPILEGLGYLSPFMMVSSLFGITLPDTTTAINIDIFSQLLVNRDIYYAINQNSSLIIIICVIVISVIVCVGVYKNKDLKI
jgi:ABC-type transport system involved in multi-copper enzyme maturation permease subunit